MDFEKCLKKETNDSIKKIGRYLLSRNDINLNKPGKTIEGMWQYIKNQAKKQAVGGFACIDDNIVLGWAVHYFDEETSVDDTESNIYSKSKQSKKKSDNIQLSLFGD